jgi:hypothetical protein
VDAFRPLPGTAKGIFDDAHTMIYETKLYEKWTERGECLAGFGTHVSFWQRDDTAMNREVGLWKLDLCAVRQLMRVIVGHGIAMVTADLGRSSCAMWSSM